ncbi:MAG: DUF1177 domain-containing protein [Deltaproteobacteria bacterium]|nr:DUF1177 domain-containing protein [Deltaproteobacteria bacterium]
MLLKEVIEICDLLDDSHVSGNSIVDFFAGFDLPATPLKTLHGSKGKTDVVRICIPGKNGKTKGKSAPTLGVLGTLGGIGARPEVSGLVSDADGALVALSAALKLARMRQRGDECPGDVHVATHICPDAPTQPHDPTPFMASPVSIFDQIAAELHPDMDAILSIDTTKGNRIINHQGFAISPTVKEGYILRVSEDLLRIMEYVTGDFPCAFPITMQDITPYGNGIYHLNSIMQPSVMTDCPVVGVAVTTRSAVPGCASGANMPLGLESTARFIVEVAKTFGLGTCKFYDESQFARMKTLYGSMDKLRKRKTS